MDSHRPGVTNFVHRISASRICRRPSASSERRLGEPPILWAQTPPPQSLRTRWRFPWRLLHKTLTVERIEAAARAVIHDAA
jgi:hypothetical protein